MTSAEASLLHEASVVILQFNVDKLKIVEAIGDSVSFFGVTNEACTEYTLLDYISQTDAATLRDRVELLRTQDKRGSKLVFKFEPCNRSQADWVSVDLREVVAQGLFVRAVLTHCNDAVSFGQSRLAAQTRIATSAKVIGNADNGASPKDTAEHIDELELKCCCSARPLFECQFCTAHGSPMCLGTGSFAKIYRACWLGTTVAVKHYSAPAPGRIMDAQRSFEKELSVFRSMRHPNMIRFFGANTSRLALVIEVAEGGSLSDYIKLSSVKEFANTVWPDHMRIATEITCGLLYLHVRNIAHGDIKSFNILMTNDGMAKISDFGTAVALGGSTSKENTPLSYAWSSPERLEGSPLTSEADIYSLGIVFWELCTCSLPYDEFKGGVKELKKAVVAGDRPLITGRMKSYLSGYVIPSLMVTLFQSCWTVRPDDRPSGRKVYETLCNVKAHWKCGSCGWLNPPEQHDCAHCLPELYEGLAGTIYSTEGSSGQRFETKELQDVRRSDVSVEQIQPSPVIETECTVCSTRNSSSSAKCRDCGCPLFPTSDVRRVVQDSSSLLIQGIEQSLIRRRLDPYNHAKLTQDFAENPDFYDNWCCDMCQTQNDMLTMECKECHARCVDTDMLDAIKAALRREPT